MYISQRGGYAGYSHREPFYDRPERGGGTVTVEGKEEGKDVTSTRDTSYKAEEFKPDEDLKKLIHDQTQAIKASSHEQANWREKWPEMMDEFRKAMAKSQGRAIDGGHRDPQAIELKDYLGNPVMIRPKAEDLAVEIRKANNAVLDAHLYMSAMMMRGGMEKPYDTSVDEKGVCRGMRNLDSFKRLQELRKKAAGDFWETGGTAAGAEWVPTGFVSEVLDVTRLETGVPALFRQVTIPQGVGTLRLPVTLGKASWAVVAESDEAALSYPFGPGNLVNSGTGFVALTPVKHKGISGMSREETEDAIVAVVSEARNQIALNGMESLESAMINGQTNNQATLDAALGPVAANGYGNGLRNYGIVTNTNTVNAGGGALTLANTETARAQMGRWGVRPDDLSLITTPGGYIDLLQETDSPVKTVDQYGNQATLVSGELARLYGYRIFVSDEIPANLDATGVADAAGALTSSIMVNRTRWRRGNKRGMEIRQIDLVGDDAIVLVGFMRTAFNTPTASPLDTDDHTVVIINQLR